MPKARHRKETSFQNTVTRSVFLYGKPNTGKCSVLDHMVSAFTKLVNRDIRILDSTPGIFLQLVKNDKKDPEMRKLEKTLRIPGYNSTFCQNAFDQAVTHLSNRLDSIRTEMIHKDCIREIQGLTDREFSFLMKEFRDQYAMMRWNRLLLSSLTCGTKKLPSNITCTATTSLRMWDVPSSVRWTGWTR